MPPTQKCPDCDKSFQYAFQLNSHQLKNHSKEKLVCSQSICIMKFLDTADLHIHEITAHPSCYCQKCAKLFPSPQNLKSHVCRPFKCEQCNRAFKSADAFAKHSESHGTQMVARVPFHGTHIEKNDYTTGISKHTSLKLGTPTEKENATARFNKPRARSEKIYVTSKPISKQSSHMENKYVSTEFACYVCMQSFQCADTLCAHQEAEHVNNAVFSCPVCEQWLSSAEAMHTHKRVKHENYNPCAHPECAVCHTRFEQVSELLEHLKCHIIFFQKTIEIAQHV